MKPNVKNTYFLNDVVEVVAMLSNLKCRDIFGRFLVKDEDARHQDTQSFKIRQKYPSRVTEISEPPLGGQVNDHIYIWFRKIFFILRHVLPIEGIESQLRAQHTFCMLFQHATPTLLY